MIDFIEVRGARVHSLKNLNVDIPRGKLVVFTGPSGSGKSSLAFDTLFQEGQRRYMNSLSDYARQFLDQLEKPDVDSITGLSPTISIDQKTISHHPRSTVGTVTEIYDYLRLLYAKVSEPVCYQCHRPIVSQTPQQILDQLFSYSEGTQLSLLAPIFREKKGEHQQVLEELRGRGFVKVRVDGVTQDLSEELVLSKNKKHSLEVYVDRWVVKKNHSDSQRLLDSIQLALKLGKKSLVLLIQEPQREAPQELLVSENFVCLPCRLSYPQPEPRLFSFNSPLGACPQCKGLGVLEEGESSQEGLPCPNCSGSRLRKESLSFLIHGRSIAQLCEDSLSHLVLFFQKKELWTERQLQVVGRVLKEIQNRLFFLTQVGVGYLSLARSTQTLSGGESQRLRLASQVGSSLVDVTYVLDEPSIGLHSQDHQKLIQTLKQLRDLGNSVLVVEHDQEMMEQADWILDLGPGAGKQGGEITAFGTYDEILQSPTSLTGKYLRGECRIEVPKQRRPFRKQGGVQIRGARRHHLKDLDVFFPGQSLICVTGVSGSGKSSLVFDVLLPQLEDAVVIDQKPIGRSPRSNPATYTGMFQWIRDLFTQLPESRRRGLAPGYFSFNVDGGGRCSVCEGDGAIRVEMHFLPPVYVPCEVCQGRRYQEEALKIQYKGKNIAELLRMTVDEAAIFLAAVPPLAKRLQALQQVGLGYLELGQSATTLSGGEAQRLKLSTELVQRIPSALQKAQEKGQGTNRFYLLDEPSTGLHFEDIKKLLQILHALVDQGKSVIVIEHHLDIIKNADYVIDLGPTGGDEGGYLVALGTPEEVAQNPKSSTGQFLKRVLKSSV